MTGYGKAEFTTQGRKLRVEIKSLNSKSLDVNFRVPQRYRGLELSARKTLARLLHRGKIEVHVFEEWVDTQEAAPLNKTVIEHYLEQLHSIRPLGDEYLLPTAMRLPNTLLSTSEELTDEEQAAFLETLTKAADKLVAYRTEEGAALEQDLSDQLTQIAHQQQQIDSASSGRIAQRREKLEEQLNQLTAEFNQERLEQELIFYLEKWDINCKVIISRALDDHRPDAEYKKARIGNAYKEYIEDGGEIVFFDDREDIRFALTEIGVKCYDPRIYNGKENGNLRYLF